MNNEIIWHTEKRKLSQLKPCDWNPRKTSEKETDHLSKSIEKFNLADPFIVNQNNVIVGGHLRYKILKSKNKDDFVVDVRVPSRLLTDDEVRELNIRLNRNTGAWDFDLLADFNENFLANIGFDSSELDDIFQINEAKQDDEVPDLKTTKIKDGDMFQLGNHYLLCGDSTKKENVEKLMGHYVICPHCKTKNDIKK